MQLSNKPTNFLPKLSITLLISSVFFDSVDEETIKTFLAFNLSISLSIASRDGVSQITLSKGLYV